MSTLKNEVISLINTLPDDVDIADIVEALVVRQKILRGIKDSEEGRCCTHEEAREMIDRWLESDG